MSENRKIAEQIVQDYGFVPDDEWDISVAASAIDAIEAALDEKDAKLDIATAALNDVVQIEVEGVNLDQGAPWLKEIAQAALDQVTRREESA